MLLLKKKLNLLNKYKNVLLALLMAIVFIFSLRSHPMVPTFNLEPIRVEVYFIFLAFLIFIIGIGSALVFKLVVKDYMVISLGWVILSFLFVSIAGNSVIYAYILFVQFLPITICFVVGSELVKLIIHKKRED